MKELGPNMRDQMPDGGILGDVSAHMPNLPPLDDGDFDVESLLEQVHEQTEEPGLRARLQELPSAWRVAGALLVVAMISSASFILGIRGDLSQQSLLTYGVPLILCGVGAAGAVMLALRGAHKPPIRRSAWVVAGMLLTPALLGLLPATGMDSHGALKPLLGCLMTGTIAAAATGGGVLLFSRWLHQDRNTLALAAGTGGMVGFILLQLHCPAGDLTHLVFAHGSLGVLVAAVFLLIGRLTRPE